MEKRKLFLGAIFIIGIIIITIIVLINSKPKHSISKELQEQIGIDLKDEYYKDKDVYEKDGNVIIEDKDGNKTIITVKDENKSNLENATDEVKSQYTLSEVNVALVGNMTRVTGKITNNTQKTHKVLIQTKFYKADGKVAGTLSSTVSSIKAGETKDFSSTIMGNYTTYRYETFVEFTD